MPKTAKKVSPLQRVGSVLRHTALEYPHTEAAHPWGETRAMQTQFVEWLDESFRAVAPKNVVDALDAEE